MEGAIRGGSCGAISAARAFVADPFHFRTVTGHTELNAQTRELGGVAGAVVKLEADHVAGLYLTFDDAFRLRRQLRLIGRLRSELSV